MRISPTGTLIQKIQCQVLSWITAPPTSGPSATAMPLIPDQTPSARPRFSGGKASASRVSVSGVTIAAPAPCSARVAIRMPMFGASADPADATVKRMMPATNMRLRPKRSPSAAPVRSRTAKESTNPLTVHSSVWIEAPRSRWMLGRATVTTRLSRTHMNRPTETISSVQRRLRDATACLSC